MDKEVKTKWVTALRSGAYKQGHHNLKSTKAGKTCHCVLGVLADVYFKEKGTPWNMKREGAGQLSPELISWAGFINPTRVDETLTIHCHERAISTHNDIGIRFPALADAIEEQL